MINTYRVNSVVSTHLENYTTLWSYWQPIIYINCGLELTAAICI